MSAFHGPACALHIFAYMKSGNFGSVVPTKTDLNEVSPRRHDCKGGTLAELIISMGICSFGFAGLSAVSLHCSRALAVQRETVAANQLVQERLEHVRAGGWSQVTDVNAVRDRILGATCSNVDALPCARERITVTPYPAVSPAPSPLCVERAADGSINTVSEPPAGFSLRKTTGVRVDVHVEWISHQAPRVRVREVSTVVALGGILK